MLSEFICNGGFIIQENTHCDDSTHQCRCINISFWKGALLRQSSFAVEACQWSLACRNLKLLIVATPHINVDVFIYLFEKESCVGRALLQLKPSHAGSCSLWRFYTYIHMCVTVYVCIYIYACHRYDEMGLGWQHLAGSVSCFLFFFLGFISYMDRHTSFPPFCGWISKETPFWNPLF